MCEREKEEKKANKIPPAIRSVGLNLFPFVLFCWKDRELKNFFNC